MRHVGGELRVGGVRIPPDTWIALNLAVLNDGTRLYLDAAQQGHTLALDADMSQPFYQLRGYFIVDGEYEIFAEFERVDAW